MYIKLLRPPLLAASYYNTFCPTNLAVSSLPACLASTLFSALWEARAPLLGGPSELEHLVRGMASAEGPECGGEAGSGALKASTTH